MTSAVVAEAAKSEYGLDVGEMLGRVVHQSNGDASYLPKAKESECESDRGCPEDTVLEEMDGRCKGRMWARRRG